MNTMADNIMKEETKLEVQAMIDTALEQGVSVVVVPASKGRAPRAAPAVTAKESFVGPMPLAIKKRTSRPVQDDGTKYTFSEKMGTVRHDLTLQGAHLHLGRDWRNAGYKAPSIRANALTALVEAFGDTEEEPVFTKAEAVAVLATLPDLGCSTPASRFTKFVKSGHIVAA